VSDKIEYMKSIWSNLSDIVDDNRFLALTNIVSEPQPRSQPSPQPQVDGKLYESIESVVKVNPDEIKTVVDEDQKEIEREKEIERKLREKQPISKEEIKEIANDATEEVKNIKRTIRREAIPDEIRKLYDRYIKVNPSYVNLRAFMIFVKRVMEAYPNGSEYQEILDRVDFGSVIEAIKERKKYGEYLQEALNDAIRRTGGKKEIDVESELERTDILNKQIDIFSRLIRLLFKIYSEYRREEDWDAVRGILRILHENFDIREQDIPGIQSNVELWVMEHIDYLPE
jgi:hypothetical protein